MVSKKKIKSTTELNFASVDDAIFSYGIAKDIIDAHDKGIDSIQMKAGILLGSSAAAIAIILQNQEITNPLLQVIPGIINGVNIIPMWGVMSVILFILSALFSLLVLILRSASIGMGVKGIFDMVPKYGSKKAIELWLVERKNLFSNLIKKNQNYGWLYFLALTFFLTGLIYLISLIFFNENSMIPVTNGVVIYLSNFVPAIGSIVIILLVYFVREKIN